MENVTMNTKTNKILRYLIQLLLLVLTLPGMAFQPESKADSLYRSALSKLNNSDPANAMQDLFSLLKYAEKGTNNVSAEGLARAHLTLGNIYLTYGDYEHAAAYYEKGNALTKHDLQKIRFAYNLCMAYSLLNDEKKSRLYLQRLSALQPADSALWAYDKIMSAALIEKQFGNRTKSLNLYKEGVAVVDRLGLSPQYYAVYPISEIVDYYDQTDELDSSRVWLERYAQLAPLSDSPHVKADCLRVLMRYAIRSGDCDSALEYSQQYLEIVDSMVNYSNFIKVTANHERKREALDRETIQDLQFTVSKQKILIFSIFLLAIVGLGLWLLMRKVKSSRRTLFARNREIAILETEISEATHQEGTDHHPSGPATPEIAGKTTDETNQWDNLMKTIKAQLDDKPENYCNPDFSIIMLAALCNSNAKYVSQAINETTGDNFRALINGYRIREARRRLTTDSSFAQLTINTIGESVGFRSASNFIAAFKKVTGMTPSIYRKLTLKNQVPAMT